jgi:hypothetical protein
MSTAAHPTAPDLPAPGPRPTIAAALSIRGHVAWLQLLKVAANGSPPVRGVRVRVRVRVR